MKRLLLFLIAVAMANCAFSQGAAINSSGAGPAASAMLDVSSTNKGMLVPRMLKAEKLLISNPATGLLIYQTDDTTGFWYFDSFKWVQAIGPAGSAGASPAYTVGTYYPDLGGLVFQVNSANPNTVGSTGTHGLVAAPSDQSTNSSWLLADNDISIYVTANASAMKYSDWRVPTKQELNLMYVLKSTIGGFINANYWSSTLNYQSNMAYAQDFTNGSITVAGTDWGLRVRAVRSF